MTHDKLRPSPIALIFDCDGVLVDTEPLGRRVLQEVLNERRAATGGGPTTLAAAVWPDGEPLGTALRMAAAAGSMGGDRADPALLEDLVRRRMGVELARRSWAVAGMPALVARVHQLLLDRRGRPSVAVCSNGPSSKMALALRPEDYGCIDPTLILSGTDRGIPKPAPDLLLLAAGLMGVPPAQCLVIDDSRVGIESARRAGMTAVAFGPHGDALREAGLADEAAPDAAALGALIAHHLGAN